MPAKKKKGSASASIKDKSNAVFNPAARNIFRNVRMTVNRYTSFSLGWYSKYFDPMVSFCGTIFNKKGLMGVSLRDFN